MCLGGLIFFLMSLLDLFFVSIHVGYSIVVKRIVRKCHVSLSHRVTLVDLVELDILYFYVILIMYCLHSFYVSTDCITRVVKFQFPNERVLERKKEIICLRVSLSLVIKL